MNLISILDRFGQFLWVGETFINEKSEIAMGVTVFVKQLLLKCRVPGYYLFEALTNSISVNSDYLFVVGEVL